MTKSTWIIVAGAIFLFFLMVSRGHAAELTAQDIKMALASVGVNPGTTQEILNKGFHRLLTINVTGRKGRWVVVITEKEVGRTRAEK